MRDIGLDSPIIFKRPYSGYLPILVFFFQARANNDPNMPPIHVVKSHVISLIIIAIFHFLAIMSLESVFYNWHNSSLRLKQITELPIDFARNKTTILCCKSNWSWSQSVVRGIIRAYSHIFIGCSWSDKSRQQINSRHWLMTLFWSVQKYNKYVWCHNWEPVFLEI